MHPLSTLFEMILEAVRKDVHMHQHNDSKMLLLELTAVVYAQGQGDWVVTQPAPIGS